MADLEELARVAVDNHTDLASSRLRVNQISEAAA
jgi:hypothetical protein